MKTHVKMTLGIIAGSILGFAYYYFFGCKNGCPLTSRWYITTVYGAIFGLIANIPDKKHKQ